MSNRDETPMRFACVNCGEPIHIIYPRKGGIKIKGAVSLPFEGPFDGSNPFVDLHIDFPVSFEPYVMGMTAFMKGVQRIGYENYQVHNHRLNALNFLYPKVDTIKRVMRLYDKNPDLFGRLCKKEFSEELRSSEQKDLNLALYAVIAKVFFPFSMPNENAESVNIFMRVTRDLMQGKKEAFDKFIRDIISNDFLKNLQKDCLEIYPEILKYELVFRPALFLDFDQQYQNELVAFRVSTDEFLTYKDLYKDISEIMSRQMVLIAGINNIILRGDHNEFGDFGKRTPKSLNKYADVAFGQKIEFLDDCWYEIDESLYDNQLRNSIAHFKAEYDDVSQKITYYPRKEGMNQEKQETLFFMDFIRKCLLSYREMHRMHHLIKCLFNYYYIIYSEKA